MTTEYSLISVHFKSLDKKDNILIHWNILPNGVPIITKGELLDDDVEVKPEWKDERYSANRGLRLFRVVEQAMLKKHGMFLKKKIKIGIDPKGADILQDIIQNPDPTSDDLMKQVEELVKKAEALKTEEEAAEAAKLKTEEETKNIDKPLSSGANPFEALSVKELKGVLELREQPFPSKANKAALIDLIMDPPVTSTEIPTETPKAASAE